jgi:hypothetical protein
MKTSYGIQRLDYRLPDFLRVSWVSDAARTTWEPRFERLKAIWRDLEYRSVIEGLRRCTLQIIPESEYEALAQEMAHYGLTVLQLDHLKATRHAYSSVQSTYDGQGAVDYRVVVGLGQDVLSFKAAWSIQDQSAIGDLLGIPSCCSTFYHTVWDIERFVDTTWPMAYNTQPKTESTDHRIDIAATPYANVLLRWLGARPVMHLPCSFTCEATDAIGQAFFSLGRQAGFLQEMGWLWDILNWSVEWSTLHGIAEIKTAVVKVATLTDSTPEKYSVRYLGNSIPAESMQGLDFPYVRPDHHAISDSTGFQNGLIAIQ